VPLPTSAQPSERADGWGYGSMHGRFVSPYCMRRDLREPIFTSSCYNAALTAAGAMLRNRGRTASSLSPLPASFPYPSPSRDTLPTVLACVCGCGCVCGCLLVLWVTGTTDEAARIAKCRALVASLPEQNRNILAYLFRFLHEVSGPSPRSLPAPPHGIAACTGVGSSLSVRLRCAS
jgi:hypothetical protein